MSYPVSAPSRSDNAADSSPIQARKAANNKNHQGQQAQGEKDPSFHYNLDILIEIFQ